MPLFTDPHERPTGEFTEDLVRATRNEPMKRYEVLTDTNAGWLVAKKGDVVELQESLAERLGDRLKALAPEKKAKAQEPETLSDDPPGAPPIVKSHVSSQSTDAGGKRGKWKGKGK